MEAQPHEVGLFGGSSCPPRLVMTLRSPCCDSVMILSWPCHDGASMVGIDSEPAFTSRLAARVARA